MIGAKCWCGGKRVTHSLRGEYDPEVGYCLDSEFHDPDATGVPDRITTLYVAGPMSGISENNYPAFHDAAAMLRGAGYTVVNPAEFGVEGKRVHYVDLIREDLRGMLDCHGIAVLEDWWNSSGARNEVQVGGLLKMPTRTVAEWLARAAYELHKEA